jgi:hypothetical protein
VVDLDHSGEFLNFPMDPEGLGEWPAGLVVFAEPAAPAVGPDRCEFIAKAARGVNPAHEAL